LLIAISIFLVSPSTVATKMGTDSNRLSARHLFRNWSPVSARPMPVEKNEIERLAFVVGFMAAAISPVLACSTWTKPIFSRRCASNVLDMRLSSTAREFDSQAWLSHSSFVGRAWLSPKEDFRGQDVEQDPACVALAGPV
jgi:hypothetical protein